MKKFSILAAVTLLFVSVSVTNAAENSTAAGFHFLRTFPGARPSAMSGAFVSFSGDIHSIYFNPAGLAEIKGRVASASYLNHVLDFQSGFAAYSQSFKNWGQFAVSVNYMDYGEFDETDINGNQLGKFNAGSYYLTTSLGRRLTKNLLIGASAKFIHSTIDKYSASAVAMDLGMIYHVPFIQDFNFGVGVFNLGTAVSAFIDSKDALPLNVVVGFSKKLAHLPLEYSISANKYIDDDVQLNVGGEFTLAQNVWLRLGYSSYGKNQKVGATGDQFAGLSLGLGMLWRSYQFDYSLSSYGAIGYLNRVSFSYRF
ncbi:MAG: PorV/PorQ family protein [Calditrichaeota bacterium]|nr:PorV/PorQ family protein [Calditrichota bacterium]